MVAVTTSNCGDVVLDVLNVALTPFCFDKSVVVKVFFGMVPKNQTERW